MSEKKKGSLKIVSMDKKTKKNKKIEKLNPLLPKPPFRWSIVGCSNSGKTTMLCNLFTKEFYGKFWKKDHIFVFSPTISLDDKLRDCIPSNNFYDKFDPEILKEIYSEQHSIKKVYGKAKMDHILIILDDMLGTAALKRSSIISKFIHKTRHYNVSFIYSVQHYKGLTPVVRNNSDVMAIFRSSNFGEIDTIIDEMADKASKKEFRKVLVEVFKNAFQFLMIDNKTHDLTKQFRIGFEDFIDNPMLKK